MTLYEFNALDEMEQAEAVWDAVHIGVKGGTRSIIYFFTRVQESSDGDCLRSAIITMTCQVTRSCLNKMNSDGIKIRGISHKLKQSIFRLFLYIILLYLWRKRV